MEAFPLALDCSQLAAGMEKKGGMHLMAVDVRTAATWLRLIKSGSFDKSSWAMRLCKREKFVYVRKTRAGSWELSSDTSLSLRAMKVREQWEKM